MTLYPMVIPNPAVDFKPAKARLMDWCIKRKCPVIILEETAAYWEYGHFWSCYTEIYLPNSAIYSRCGFHIYDTGEVLLVSRE